MAKSKHNIREIRIEIHRGKNQAVTGHTVHHSLLPTRDKSSKSGAFLYEDTRESYPFGAKGEAAGDGPNMGAHIMQHLGAAAGK